MKSRSMTLPTLPTDEARRPDAFQASDEKRIGLALQHAGVGIWEMDYRTGRLTLSAATEAHYGLVPGTFEGTQDAFVERIHPADRRDGPPRVPEGVGVRRALLNRVSNDLARWLRALGGQRRTNRARRARRTGPRRRHVHGRHEPPRAGRAESPGPEDGSGRPAGRRRGARLQQPAHGDLGYGELLLDLDAWRPATARHPRDSEGRRSAPPA